MNVLALDTCLAACSVALAADGRVLAWRSEAMARGHQERLALMTGAVMAEARLPFATIDLIGVTVGPGSFTGLRVGLAFAKGVALALDRRCVGVGTLEALAATVAIPGPRASVIDAGRGRVYLQLFDGAAALTGPDILTVEEALARVAEVFPSGELTLAGPGAGLLIGALPRGASAAVSAPDPRAVARLAAAAPGAPPRPLYLRPPDAKLPATARVVGR